MDAEEVQRQFDVVCDHGIVYHGYVDYMRDYAVYVYCTADPKTGIAPETVQLLFKNCVVANIETALSAEIWRRSLDDRLIDYATGVDLDGYVWGVKWQVMYPGGTVLSESPIASQWSTALGVTFHEAHIETNGHNMVLVFTDLVSTVVERGYSPFTVDGPGPDSKMPW